MNRDELARQARGDEMQHRPGPAIASQATAIETTRAVAQVQGALVVARQNPRDEIKAAERAREAFNGEALADRCFFAFRRAGSSITGPSIHFAVELARCWGNIEYGVAELQRDDEASVSEMQAFAWDLETNHKVVNTFIVPHSRDTRQGKKALTEDRDIYENNANNAARRLRECILRCVPSALRDECIDIARHTIEEGGGIPIEKRRENMLEAYARIGVTRRQIEKRMSESADKLSAYSLAQLKIILQSIKRGEISKDSEFPPDEVELAREALEAARKPQESAPKPEAETSSPSDEASGTAATAEHASATRATLMEEWEIEARELGDVR